MTATEGFYVTVQRAKAGGGVRTGFLLGPYPTHGEALAKVDLGRRLARDADPWTAFDAFGTSKVTTPAGTALPPGKLNQRAGTCGPSYCHHAISN